MANRVIRDWTDSLKMDALSFQAEVLFTRLTMKADDYGSFHANIKLVKAALFPLKLDTIREADISRWMDELLKAGLIVLYEVESKPYLRILNFGQRMRSMKKRFPDMPDDISPQIAADCRRLRPEEKRREIEIEGEVEGLPSPPPSSLTFDEYYDNSLKKMSPAECAKEYFTSKQYTQAIELLCMNLRIQLPQLKSLAVAFNEHVTIQGKIERPLQEWAKHFGYWAKDPKRQSIQQNQNNGNTETPAEKRSRLIQQQAELQRNARN